MSRDASVTTAFGDNEYVFRLAWGEWLKLQESRDVGPHQLAIRLHDSTWRLEDVREVIRVGLIGGGMDPVQALKLVRQYVESDPAMTHLALAQLVVAAGLVGASDEKLGENHAANPMGSESTISPMAN